jgi:hypothetical protein
MASNLFECGMSLEDAFFRKRDAELIEQQQKLEKIKRTREALTQASGIHDLKVIDKLIELDISVKILSSIAIVPLVELAWADGEIDQKERDAVLAGAAENGMKKGSVDYELLEHWLSVRPPAKLLDAWMHYIQGLCQIMDPAECRSFKKEIMGRASKVAEASGGLLGLALKISSQELAVLKKMEGAFRLG